MIYKQVIVVRKDLKLGVGKTAAQVAHASVGAMEKTNEKTIEHWKEEGAKKVVLKVDTLKELSEIQKKVKAKKIPYFVVVDAGLTQIKRGTVTCIGIGPAEEKKIDELTKNLKLL